MRRSGGTPGVAVDEAGLDLDGAAHRVDHAAKLDDRSIPGTLNDAAVMGGDGRVDEVASEPSEARECAVLVGDGQPTVTDDIRNQDRG